MEERSSVAKDWNSERRGLSRREALRFGAGAMLGTLLPTRAVVASAGARMISPQSSGGNLSEGPSWNTEFKELAPSVYAYIQGGGPWSRNDGVSNGGCIAGPDFLVAIDALQAPIATKSFIAAASKATGKSFGRVINTHHHLDHTAGNVFFLPAEITAHDFCREMLIKSLGSPRPDYWKKREGWADGTEEWKVAPPVKSFNEKITQYYGDLKVESIFVGPAHTWGDVMVYLPQLKILFAGDVAFHRVVPTAWQGHVSNWIERVDMILAMDVETIVPGHGPVGGKKELADMRDYFAILKREARKRYDAGMSAGHAAADIGMGKYDTWSDPDRIVANVLRLYEEFDGTISPANDVEATRKATAEYRSLKGIRS